MSHIDSAYVITPSVAIYSCLDFDGVISTQKSLIAACNAFLARATFHGATLYVPMIFYSQVTQLAFAAFQSGDLEYKDAASIAKQILETAWDYRIPTTDEIFEMLQLAHNPSVGDGEYLAIAHRFACPVITTIAHPLQTSAAIQVLEVQQHPWANSGGLEDFPPDTK
jgi:hypothetical protein